LFQSVYDIQNTIREGVVACHTLLEELRQNTDTEKLTIHNFVQTLHDAINKIQTDMHLEVQRYVFSAIGCNLYYSNNLLFFFFN